ncbi:MAG: thiamine diphosphokinase [Lachnospirales bacterium]
MKCVVISSGTIRDYDAMKKYINKKDFIVCNDGGLAHCKGMKIMPDIILGDFDSVDPRLLGKYKKNKILPFPPEKNYTDSHLAYVYAMENFEKILILGSTGTRMDHSMTNINMLAMFLENNKKAILIDDNNIIRPCNSNVAVRKNNMKYISLLPLSEKVVFENSKGLKYPLKGIVLALDKSIGVSNEILDEIAYIKVKEGRFLIIQSKD